MTLLHTPSTATPRFLEGQVVVLTAADRGFGRVMAQGLAGAGATLVLVGKIGEQLQALSSHIERGGATAIPMQADVSAPLDWLKVQRRVLDIFGALSGVVHSADKRTHPELTSLNEAEWMELFQANVKSSVSIAQMMAHKLPEAWLTVIGPHLDEGGLHGHTQRAALRGLLDNARETGFRTNILLPSRSPCGQDELDKGVVAAVTALASPELRHLNAMCIDLPLPPVRSSDFAELSPEQQANYQPAPTSQVSDSQSSARQISASQAPTSYAPINHAPHA